MTLGLAALRAATLGALVLLAWNPTAARVARGVPPLVLLDASLSMAGHGGRWRDALDTARALAQGGVIWRFGERVAGFDSLPPVDGASRLAPALDAAAARGGSVTVVSDGAIADFADIPPDLVRGARIVVLPRASFFDAFVSDISGPARIGVGDTVRLKVSYGTAGKRERGNGKRTAPLAASVGGRRLASRVVDLPDSGVVSADLPFPASRFPFPGWVVVEVGLEGVGDEEARDDARSFVLEVSAPPSIVVLASPPDWDTRFLAHALEDVAHAAVKVLVAADPGGTRWRDAATLAAVPAGEVARAVRGAELLVEAGDPATFARAASRGAVLLWSPGRRQEGDWYLQPPAASPIAGALAGVAWDSLPPVTALGELAPYSPPGWRGAGRRAR